MGGAGQPFGKARLNLSRFHRIGGQRVGVRRIDHDHRMTGECKRLSVVRQQCGDGPIGRDQRCQLGIEQAEMVEETVEYGGDADTAL